MTQDGRKNNGGKRIGAGRKPKAEEIKLIERLTPLADEAFKQLKKGVEAGDFKFVQMYLHYFAGKPKETKDVNVITETPLFNINYDAIVDDIMSEDDTENDA